MFYKCASLVTITIPNSVTSIDTYAFAECIKLNDLVNLIYKIDPNMELQISTNGTNLESFKHFDNVNKLESIHISRHHYLDYENYEIFQK